MRLVCMTESFEAKKVNVGFLFDATGLDAGDIVKGDVQIVSNMGEYYIPFAFSIVHGIVRSSLGNVKNLFHFTNQDNCRIIDGFKSYGEQITLITENYDDSIKGVLY